jgi:hypothetical protein
MGDDEEIKFSDLGITDEFSFHEQCLQNGVCPLCGGPLVTKNYNERNCACGFTHWNANPERTPHATE